MTKLTFFLYTALTGIVPVLVSETSSADHRGGSLGYVFIANCQYSHLILIHMLDDTEN